MKLRLLVPAFFCAIAQTSMAGDAPKDVLSTLDIAPSATPLVSPIFDVLTRYEYREEDPFDASHGLISRTRFGLKTAEVNGWNGLVEGELTRALIDDYKSNPTGSNATSPFKPNNTVIFDPENLEVNRA